MQQDAIQVTIGEHKNLTVRVPRVDRDSLIQTISSFFGKNDKEIAGQFRKLLGQAGEITLTITTMAGK